MARTVTAHLFHAVNVRSAQWISHMSPTARLHPDFGPSYGAQPVPYGIPITYVLGSHPKVSVRFVNSIAPLIPSLLLGTRSAPLHRGQVGQPSPEFVSRTAPPVTTMTTDMTSAERADRWTVRGSGVQRAAMKESGLRRAATASARVTFGTGPS